MNRRRGWTSLTARLLGALLSLASGLDHALACGRETDCALADGAAYRVNPPRGWDGRSPLPIALYFHGWQQTAELVMRNEDLVEAFSEIGVLLVAVDGLGKTWTFPGSPSQARDDVVVALAALDDVERRFPVDRRRVWATGYSQGGSMAWWLACAAGGRFAALVPFAGAFWEPMRTDCPGGPANILHVHGLSDRTVPMEGRVVGGRFRQGDVLRGLAVWRRVNGCVSDEAEALTREGDLGCRRWRLGCASGRELRLCLHEGGHELNPAWIRDAWAFVAQVAAARAQDRPGDVKPPAPPGAGP